MISITPEGVTIAIICAIISFISISVRLAVTDVKRTKEIQKHMKQHQQKIKELQKKGEAKEMQKINEEIIALTMENMKMMYKPMFITLVPFILIFSFMSGSYGDMHPAMNATLIDVLPQNLPIDNVTIQSGNAVYHPENRTVEWNLSKIRADWTAGVSVKYTISNGSLGNAVNEKATLIYVDPKVTREPYSLDLFGTIIYGPEIPTFSFGKDVSVNSDQASAEIINLKKSVELIPAENAAVEKLEYQNSVSNNVVYFPLNLDLWLILFTIHIHNGMDWFLWYFTISVIFAMIINKIAEEVYVKKKCAQGA
jgi:uncharacterized membrane protein (DUF106 family)